MSSKSLRIDDLDLFYELRNKYPNFPLPKQWGFKLTFTLSIAAMLLAFIGIIISVTAFVISDNLLKNSILNGWPGFFLLVLFVVLEMWFVGWLERKYEVIDPGGEYYLLKAYRCVNCEPPMDDIFFSMLRATLTVNEGGHIQEMTIPVTYGTARDIYHNLSPKRQTKPREKNLANHSKCYFLANCPI